MDKDSHWTHAEIKRATDSAWESGYLVGLSSGLSTGWALAKNYRSVKFIRDELRRRLDELDKYIVEDNK